jgi:hypothetical protein
MRRALLWTAAIIGIAALAWWLRGRARAGDTPAYEPGADLADELRRALDESRTEQDRTPEQKATEPAGEASIEDRRADVHARAESAIARMREGDG